MLLVFSTTVVHIWSELRSQYNKYMIFVKVTPTLPINSYKDEI